MIEELNFILGLDLLRRSRQTEYVWSRYACFYLLNRYEYTNTDISKLFGMNRSTVIYGTRQFKEKLTYGDKTAVVLWNKIKYYFIDKGKGGGI